MTRKMLDQELCVFCLTIAAEIEIWPLNTASSLEKDLFLLTITYLSLSEG